ncbi:amidase family protein [Oceanicola granulosus HTCC2516]|uniref:Amidase family protein n=1 Tax=Oceanicola granulosus (strain ATCC BAA-861 / DSM 15982 / KCTC 12143 / HTCC2516) TaxID=314256 RepID=Q2CBM6_OCEGH|nr:amidase family protein [Oceanicola granulosus]EAR50105.1 amidase family protein [Oceanicola granulosus HTCC2516]
MTDPAAFADATATDIAAALRARRLRATDLAEALLERIDAHPEPVFLTVTRARALAEARAADDRLDAGRPLSPLDGVPVAFKDLFDLAGEITTAGSDTRRDAAPAEADCAAAQRLSRAGMVTLGKLNLTEFAYSGLGLNPHYGTPANPHSGATPRVPGGSSSGSGVAVAAGLAPCAMGTDTGGSIRIPAALNGVFGYKPSHHRLPDGGVFPLSRTLDTIGPLARSVPDLVALEALLAGRAPVRPRGGGVAGLRLVVPETVVLDDVEPEVMANFETALAVLAEAGALIERREMAEFAESVALAAAHGSLAAADAYVEHGPLVEGPDGGRVDARVVARILGGRGMSARDVVILQRARRRLVASVRETLDGALLAMPTVAHVAPEIAPLEADPELFHRVNLKTLRNTMIGNFLDLPGVALPSGRGAGGLPTSLLLAAASGRDDALLAAALAAAPRLGG